MPWCKERLVVRILEIWEKLLMRGFSKIREVSSQIKFTQRELKYTARINKEIKIMFLTCLPCIFFIF
jgi:hypothetical protein